MQKAKAHQRYLTSTGIKCVGVTTVLAKIAKPYLIKWSNALGLEGIDSTKYVDALANIGSLIHAFIEHDLKGTVIDLGDYSSNDITTAKVAFQKWLDWKKKTNFELLGSEMQVVSDELMVGGTVDIYGKVEGKLCVLDIKTSKSVYSEQKTQCVAYAMLLRGTGKPVEQCRILRLGRLDAEGMDDMLVGAEALHWERFLAYLNCYRVDKNLENSGGA